MTTPIYGEHELDAALAMAGVPVVLGGQCVNGFLDVSDETMIEGDAGELVGKEISVQVKNGALEGLIEGAAITVDGTKCRVTATRQLDDALTRVFCARK